MELIQAICIGIAVSYVIRTLMKANHELDKAKEERLKKKWRE